MTNEPPINVYLKSGAMAYRRSDGEWAVANPGDPLFSTITMIATHFFVIGVGWRKIDDE